MAKKQEKTESLSAEQKKAQAQKAEAEREKLEESPDSLQEAASNSSDQKASAQNEEDVQKVEIVNEGSAKVQTSDEEKNEEPVKTKSTAKQVIQKAEGANIELSENEKAAIHAATGEAGSKKYKLSDPKTQYSEDGFTLAGDQSKTLPVNPSDALIARIRSGFIVEA